MYKFLPAIIYMITCWGCENTAQETRRFSAYFDVDSLINAQLSVMADMKVEVQKVAGLNSATDSSVYIADSLRLAQELNVFRKANINKPAFEGVYSTRENFINGSRVITYSPVEEDNDFEVKELKLTYQQDNLVNVEAHVEEDHWLYDSRRVLQLKLQNKGAGINLISQYYIDGTQKMILRDRTNFIVVADILAEGTY